MFPCYNKTIVARCDRVTGFCTPSDRVTTCNNCIRYDETITSTCREGEQIIKSVFVYFQAHNDLLRTYEAKLTTFGVPTEELGFKPLESTVGGQQLGQGAAGLVAAPT